MSKTESKEVAVSEYKVLSVPSERLSMVLQNNLNGASLCPFDLDRVKVPSGGATSWEVPSLKGPESVRDLTGIILATNDGRKHYRTKRSGNAPPDCHSIDMIHGIGDPGGDCQTCAFNQFGSAVNQSGAPAKGKACSEYKLLLFIRPGDVPPIVISAPVTSLNNAKKYFLRLAQAQLMFQSVVTRLTLKQERSAGGDAYAE